MNLCDFLFSYMDSEMYEEAVRDYEKVYQTEKTKGRFLPLPSCADSKEVEASVSLLSLLPFALGPYS